VSANAWEGAGEKSGNVSPERRGKKEEGEPRSVSLIDPRSPSVIDDRIRGTISAYFAKRIKIIQRRRVRAFSIAAMQH
jgi:hypothetical protein